MNEHQEPQDREAQRLRRELEFMQHRWPLNPRFYLVVLIIVLALILSLA